MSTQLSRAWDAARRRTTRWLARRATEAGYSAVLVAIIVPAVGIGCAATAVDTGMWYVEVQKVQKVADAASLAGVPYLPQDLPSATTRAREVAKRNGYDDASPDVTVDVSVGAKATQLKVTVTSVIRNQFGSMIGVPRAVITRSAVADYQGPAPMGSPCNTFGNEPSAGTAGASASPSGTAQGPSPLPNCSRTPQFWATVEGPETGKVQGDRYQTKGCESGGVDGCTGTSNDEYDDFGYVFVVKVMPAAVNTPIDLQLYDPAFVNTGQTCALLPSSSAFGTSGNANPYVTNVDAKNRYAKNGATSPSFCTGDSFPGNGSGASTPHPMTTSFVVRQQTDTQNPKVAAVQQDTSGSACIKQYGSFSAGKNVAIPATALQLGTPDYVDDVGRLLHNWSSLCTFRPDRAGDYYLQVRTNVALAPGTGLIRSGVAAATADTGNTTTGEGSNAFAIRAVTTAGNEKNVAVSGYNHMPIYVNSDTAQPVFNLIRVLPGAAGQKISFSYFDAGDAQSGGSVTVQTPTDATGTISSVPFPGGCQATGGSAGNAWTSLTNCSAPFVQAASGSSKNNGHTETISIPIPADYSCNFASFGGCWYRVQVAFGSGSVHDVTTWDALVNGDPVRLVQ